jgi:hypothetical protein
MTDINQLKQLIIEAVQNASDADLLDLVLKLLIAEG